MAEWLKALAWKTIPASCIKWYRNTSSRNRFNDFPLRNTSRCEPVNVGVRQRFGGDLTQFLHSWRRNLPRHTSGHIHQHRVIKGDYSVSSVPENTDRSFPTKRIDDVLRKMARPGTVTTTAVPAPGVLVMDNVAPIRDARSRIPGRPK